VSPAQEDVHKEENASDRNCKMKGSRLIHEMKIDKDEVQTQRCINSLTVRVGGCEGRHFDDLIHRTAGCFLAQCENDLAHSTLKGKGAEIGTVCHRH
jgi:hypothetical protein